MQPRAKAHGTTRTAVVHTSTDAGTMRLGQCIYLFGPGVPLPKWAVQLPPKNQPHPPQQCHQRGHRSRAVAAGRPSVTTSQFTYDGRGSSRESWIYQLCNVHRDAGYIGTSPTLIIYAIRNAMAMPIIFTVTPVVSADIVPVSIPLQLPVPWCQVPSYNKHAKTKNAAFVFNTYSPPPAGYAYAFLQVTSDHAPLLIAGRTKFNDLQKTQRRAICTIKSLRQRATNNLRFDVE